MIKYVQERSVVVKKNEEDPLDGKKVKRSSARDCRGDEGVHEGSKIETTDFLWACNEEKGLEISEDWWMDPEGEEGHERDI